MAENTNENVKKWVLEHATVDKKDPNVFRLSKSDVDKYYQEEGLNAETIKLYKKVTENLYNGVSSVITDKLIEDVDGIDDPSLQDLTKVEKKFKIPTGMGNVTMSGKYLKVSTVPAQIGVSGETKTCYTYNTRSIHADFKASLDKEVYQQERDRVLEHFGLIDEKYDLKK